MGKTIVALVGIIILGTGLQALWIAPQQEHPAVLLRAAIEKEEVDGDLNAAIERYKQVIRIAGADRAVAAQALLRLGGCYEKRGPEEARQTYQQLIRDYAEQTREVAAARLRLAALKPTTREAASVPTLRLVWKGPDVELMGEPSPEGRYISFTDWDTGDLAIHDLTTGQNRRLSGQKAWDGSFAENSRWSPDGRLVAFTWATVGDTAELWVVGLDGAQPRVLYKDSEYSWATLEDWSPDGRYVLAKLYPGGSQGRTTALSLISTSDGTVRHLKHVIRSASAYMSPMRFSPDGKYIAFTCRNESVSSEVAEPADQDVCLLSADGTSGTTLVTHPADDRLLGWMPDGNGILFASDRTGAIDAWTLPVAGGRAAGEPRIVRKDIGAISPLGFTRDGAFYYGHGTDLRNIYVATIDRARETMSATYRKLELPFEGRNDMGEFSPDGKRLAYVRTSGRRISTTAPGRWSNTLCILFLDTGEEKTLPLNLQAISLRWAPDESSMLVVGFRGRHSVVRTIDLATGQARELFAASDEPDGETYVSGDWTHDGRGVLCVACRGTGSKVECRVVHKDLHTGQTSVVRQGRPGVVPMIAVSPDGTALVACEHPVVDKNEGARQGSLRIISTKDWSERLLGESLGALDGLVMPRWTRDGKSVLFTARPAGEDAGDVFVVPVGGGPPAKLGLSLRRLGQVSPHPDNVRLAFSSLGPTVKGPEVWVMENFLPVAKDAVGASVHNVKK